MPENSLRKLLTLLVFAPILLLPFLQADTRYSWGGPCWISVCYRYFIKAVAVVWFFSFCEVACSAFKRTETPWKLTLISTAAFLYLVVDHYAISVDNWWRVDCLYPDVLTHAWTILVLVMYFQHLKPHIYRWIGAGEILTIAPRGA